MHKQRRRKKRRIFRFTLGFGVHVNLISLAGQAWTFVQRFSERFARAPDAVAWENVPLRALVMTGDGRAMRRLIVRATPDSGAMVGVVDDNGAPSCDNHYEHEPWSSLRRRHGTDQVTILARRVSPKATADELTDRAARALARAEKQ